MPLYYEICPIIEHIPPYQGSAQKTLSEKHQAPRVVRNLPTYNRNSIPPAKTYKEKHNLDKRIHNADKKTRITLNRKKRDLQEKKIRYSVFDEVTDLCGTPIGRCYKNEHEQDHVIYLGDESLVKGISFSLARAGCDQVMLRAVVVTTDEGTANIKSFMRRFYKHGRKKLSNKHIRENMKQRKTISTTIDGVRVHCNLHGKISSFTSFQPYVNYLVTDDDLNMVERERFDFFTQYSQLKKWIKQTNENINSYMGRSLATLVNATREIL